MSVQELAGDRLYGASPVCFASIHDLRHSFAARALSLGESLTVIGKLLGHMRVQTTARYAHLARDSTQTTAARITHSIGGNLLGNDPEISRQ